MKFAQHPLIPVPACLPVYGFEDASWVHDECATAIRVMQTGQVIRVRVCEDAPRFSIEILPSMDAWFDDPIEWDTYETDSEERLEWHVLDAINTLEHGC